MTTLKLGTRGSRLALWQAEHITGVLKKLDPGLVTETVVIKTSGDKILDVALAKIGDKGLFTKEIEHALLRGHIDMAVHSLKDIPMEMEPGLSLAAVLQREDPRDVLLSHKGWTWEALPPGARIGTSSLRRRAQLKYRRPDLQVEDIRGNVDTRIQKMQDQDLDGIVLAYAGVVRLGMTRWMSGFLPYDIMLPAVGQGAVAVQIRTDDDRCRKLTAAFNDMPTYRAITAERSFLQELQGGCQVPIGALARIEDDILNITGVIAGLDGTPFYQAGVAGASSSAAALGKNLARQLLQQGGNTILDTIRA